MRSVQRLLLIQKQDDRPKKKKMVLLCAVLSFHLGFITQLRHHHTLLSVQRITDSTYAQKYMNKPTDRTTESCSQRSTRYGIINISSRIQRPDWVHVHNSQAAFVRQNCEYTTSPKAESTFLPHSREHFHSVNYFGFAEQMVWVAGYLSVQKALIRKSHWRKRRRRYKSKSSRLKSERKTKTRDANILLWRQKFPWIVDFHTFTVSTPISRSRILVLWPPNVVAEPLDVYLPFNYRITHWKDNLSKTTVSVPAKHDHQPPTLYPLFSPLPDSPDTHLRR